MNKILLIALLITENKAVKHMVTQIEDQEAQNLPEQRKDLPLTDKPIK